MGSSNLSEEAEELISSNKEITRPASLRTMYKYFVSADSVLLCVGILSTTAFSLLPLKLVSTVGDVAVTLRTKGGDLDAFYEAEREIAITLLVLGAVSIFFCWLAVICFIKLGSRQGFQWKKAYFASILNRPIAWFDSQNTSELGPLIDFQCNLIEHAIGDKTMLIISAIILFISVWIFSFIINIYLTLVCLCLLPFHISAALIIEYSSTNTTRKNQEHYKVAGGLAEESLEGSKTVASLNCQEIKSKEYQHELKPLKRFKQKMGLIQGIGWSMFFGTIYIIAGLLFYVGAIVYVDEPIVFGMEMHTDPEEVLMVFLATSLTGFNLGVTMPCMQYLQGGRIAATKVNKEIEMSQKDERDKALANIDGAISFKNVSFSYPSRSDIKVLDDVSFEINAGECVAIVGETGSGKSTIIQLIEGFYYADGGCVSLNGIGIKDLDLKTLREHISLVAQEPILFNCSIKENILIGRLNASNAEIEEAAKEAEANDFIESLPEKYETWAGLKGLQLSGGQKQRVAIARALIKRPKILLLDEATSALDFRTERKIQKTLDKIMLNRTTVIVAQRLSSIKNANKIIVLSNGTVSEIGTFESLVKHKGIFARLVKIQDDVDSNINIIDQDLNDSEEAISLVHPESEELSRNNGEVLKRIFSLLKQYWYWLLLSAISSIIAGSTFPIFGYYFGKNCNTINGLYGSNIIEDTKSIMFKLFILGLIIIVSLITLCAVLSRISALFTDNLRYQTLKSLLYYDQRFFDLPHSSPASISSKLSIDCENVSQLGGPILGIILLFVVSLTLGITIAMDINFRLALVIVAILPLMMAAIAKGDSLAIHGVAHNNLQQTTAIASDAMNNMKTVHSFNREEYFANKYENLTLYENQNVMKVAHVNGFFFGLRFFALYLMWANVSWYGGYEVKEKELDIKDFFTVFFLITFANWCFWIVGAFAPDFRGGIRSANEMLDIIDYVPQIDASSLNGSFETIAGKIELVDVRFSYEGRDAVVLNGISFSINPGLKLGITGTTGSGKSTIAQLLLRFYDCTSGVIYVDGVDIRNFNVRHYRESVCWVGQEPILFKGSILYNLRIGKQEISEGEALRALAKAQAMDIIEKYGLESDVGLRGNKLSGGQKQRVAIARALVRKPKVLILDESTSALDSITESKLQAEISKEEFTVIAIAHRLRTIQGFDKIIMIEKGEVVESGTHNELMCIENGHYQSLFLSSE